MNSTYKINITAWQIYLSNGVGRCLIQMTIDRPTCLVDSQNGSQSLEINSVAECWKSFNQHNVLYRFMRVHRFRAQIQCAWDPRTADWTDD